LLRTLALDPALLIDDSISLEELVVGGPSVPESGPERASVRYRLTRFFGEAELATASADEIYTRVGFDEDALSEARAWIAGEIRAFDRPVRTSGLRRSRVLPPERLPDGTMSDFPIHSATRLPPQQPSGLYWSSVVRFDPTPVQTFELASWPSEPNSMGDLPPGSTWGEEGSSAGLATTNRESGRTYASIRQGAVTRARRMVGALSPQDTEPPELREVLIRMRDTIAGPLPDGLGGGGAAEGTFRGRARICGYNFPSVTPPTGFWIEVEMSVEGVTSFDGFSVVLGREGLDCAVRGTIDGVRCTADELTDYLATLAFPFTNVGSGRFATIVVSEPGTGPRPELSSYYVVRREAEATGPLLPGQSEPITGFVVEDADEGTLECVGSPISPDLDREVRELLGVSTEDPGRSETSCAGLPEDMLLPLENELTRDSFEEESSWRHYLESARSAAATSDALGDDLVRLGIEMDLRAERQADELERLCGVRLNPTAFLRELPPRVTSSSGTDCADGYRYVGESDQCILDPIEWAQVVGALRSEDVNRLEQCIGSQSIEDWVALGDQPICMWQYGDDVTTLCEGSDQEHPCPVVAWGADSEMDCADDIPDPSARPIFIPQESALGLFQIPEVDTGTTGGGDLFPCEALARIRDGSPEEGDVAEVIGSGLLDRTELVGYTSQLGWVPGAGDYSRVTWVQPGSDPPVG
jgi:hypothetical protein